MKNKSIDMNLTESLEVITHIGVRDKIEEEGLTPDNAALVQTCLTKVGDVFDYTTDDTVNKAATITITYELEDDEIEVDLPEPLVVNDGVGDGHKLTKAQLPMYKVDGYTFDGWFNGDKLVKPKTIITEDTTLVAKFTKVDLEVSGEQEA